MYLHEQAIDTARIVCKGVLIFSNQLSVISD